MSAAQQVLASYGADAPAKAATSADFNGAAELRRAGMTGVSDAYTGAISLWFRLDGSNGVRRQLLFNTGGTVDISITSTNQVVVFISAPATSSFIQITSSSTYTAGATWHHLLASWDTNGAVGLKSKWLYIDGVLEHGAVADVGSASQVGYTPANWYVCSQSGTSFMDGCLSEVWFAPGQFVDFLQSGNRSKFRNLAGHPINLGTDGSLPTGTAPALYLSNAFSTFELNNGTGGDFAVTAAALTAGSTTP